MVCTANDLSKWDEFPKGLRVLLLHADTDTRSKLESMDYIVTTFTDETEALSMFCKKPESFHIAIVEVNESDKNRCLKFLEAAKDLPTIMTSSDYCLTTMMKCIALGAVEFLHKPLSDDKLKNIWQHVVHRAFNDGGSKGSELRKKEYVASKLHLELGNGKEMDGENPRGDIDMDTDEKDPAPSTPQLKQVSRLLGDGDCQENPNCSMENVNSSSEKEITEDQDMGESKSVEITNVAEDDSFGVKEKREEEGETKTVKTEKTDLVNCNNPSNKPCGNKNNKVSRKKVDWTAELHKKFVQAVEQLGIDQAIPSRILELMKVEGLTRHNVASHLQKFRMHRRNILPKDDHERRWIQPREYYNGHRPIQRSYNGYPQQPVMAYPAPTVYPVWGHPGPHPHARPPMWPPPPWQPSDAWHWKPPYPPVHGNASGSPLGPPPAIRHCNNFQNPAGGGLQYSTVNNAGFRMPPPSPDSLNLQPDEEVVDKVVREAMSKPWLPLPLGLKPPSADTVLAELSRQGISAVPSSSCLINGSHLC